MAESKAKDAVALLKEDHRTVEELFAQFEKAGGDGRDRTPRATPHRCPAMGWCRGW